MGERRRARGVLRRVAAAILLSLAGIGPGEAMTDRDAAFWSRPRCLDMRWAATGESIRACYHDGRSLDRAGYEAISRFLRDRRVNKTVAMDPATLDILVAVQAWTRHAGYSAGPLMINSGYRSPETNARLRGAARNSLHMRGMAVDFYVPGMKTADLGRLAAHFRGGGVGFYPESGFVHVDSGSTRYWGRVLP